MAAENQKPWFRMLPWMQKYVNTLCINCWQVKRYIDLYAATSVVGFSPQDLSHVSLAYDDAQANWLDTMKRKYLFGNNSSEELLYAFQRQINAYTNFLDSIASLARSKWTEFDLTMMDIGLCVLLTSILYHIYCITRVYATLKSVSLAGGNSLCSVTLVALFLVAMRASSFLSNSYILAEGKVANFLLVSAIIISIRSSIIQGHIMLVDVSVLLLTVLLRFRFESFMKHLTGSSFVEVFSGRTTPSSYLLMVQELLPVALLSFLAILVSVDASRLFYFSGHVIFIVGTVLSYVLIAVHWLSESNLIDIPTLIRNIGKISLPRLVYTIGSGQILFAIYLSFSDTERLVNVKKMLTATVAMLCSWNSTVLMLLGRQGSLAILLSLFGAWCIIKLQKGQACNKQGIIGGAMVKPMSVMQWNLLAVCLFFYTGHWCAFDGLRYGAAFVGFDQFNLIRQGVLLAIDTFGVSHILPILGVPFLVVLNHQSGSDGASRTLYLNMLAGFLVYGSITAVTATFTVICVRIQRRHLMVWGLFAPKYVFDVVGLVLTDVLVLLASLYYF